MLSLVGINKSYGEHHVLKNISFNVDKGEVVSIIGKSGTGKSTLLRCINLLTEVDSGYIYLDGVNILNCDLSQVRQKIGIVFQEYYLFEHLSVLENITIAPVRLLKQDKVTVMKWAMELLRIFGLEDKARVYPIELSGGQKQRVAIIRALSIRPQVILFDEPTSALDPVMTNEVVKQIHMMAKNGMTVVLATHDLNFAKQVSDRVVYIEEGEIIEEGTPDQIFLFQKSERTKRFVLSRKTD